MVATRRSAWHEDGKTGRLGTEKEQPFQAHANGIAGTRRKAMVKDQGEAWMICSLLEKTISLVHFHLHRLVHGFYKDEKEEQLHDRPTYLDKPTYRGYVHFYSFLYLCPILTIGLLYITETPETRWLCTIYMISCTSLYCVSGFYHTYPWKSRTAEIVLQRVDHAMIYFIIAGTYTPLLGIFLRNRPIWFSSIIDTMAEDQKTMIEMIPIVWAVALLGMAKSFIIGKTLSSIDTVLYAMVASVGIMPIVIQNLQALASDLPSDLLQQHYEGHAIDPWLWVWFIIGAISYFSGGIQFYTFITDNYIVDFLLTKLIPHIY